MSLLNREGMTCDASQSIKYPFFTRMSENRPQGLLLTREVDILMPGIVVKRPETIGRSNPLSYLFMAAQQGRAIFIK